jgi:hypothetical protein
MIDLKELFAGEDGIEVEFRGHTTIHYLHGPTNEEDLEYRRACLAIKVKNGRVESTDAAIYATVQLYDAICTRVIVKDGDEQQEVEDFKTLIPNDLKTAIIAAWQNRFEVKQEK